jgi:hypothetical protein
LVEDRFSRFNVGETHAALAAVTTQAELNDKDGPQQLLDLGGERPDPPFAPRLLAAFGNDPERFATVRAIQAYAGVAPVTEASGQSHWVY